MSHSIAPHTAAPDAELYCCRPLELTPLDSGRVLATLLAEREQVVLSAGVARLADSCRRFASLLEHAHACAATGQHEAQVARVLQGLIDGGLLMSKHSFVEALHAQDGQVAPAPLLRTIGMPTCRRVEGLRRGLDSYLENAIRYGHEVRAIIADDTPEPSGRASGRAALELLARLRGCEILYAGADEKRAFVERLALSCGVERRILDFALFGLPGAGPTFGGNRNALYLASAGECFFSADDDTLGGFLVPSGAAPGLCFSSHEDPTHVRMARPGQPLCGEPQSIDLFALHQRVLGRRVADVVPKSSELVHFEDSEARLLALLERGEGRIHVSWMGIAGDSGAASCRYYLHNRYTDRSGIRTDDDYRAYCQSRTILRAPQRLVLGTGTYCQTTALALDGAALLPPLFPTERGEDVLFGATLRLIHPGSLTAYHPCAVTHAPIEQRAARAPAEFGKDDGSAGHVPFSTLVLCLLDFFIPPLGKNSAEELLGALGKHFTALGRLPAAELALVIRDGYNMRIAKGVRSLEHHLRHESDALPPAYRDELRMLIDRLVASIERGEPLPREFVEGRTPTEALTFMQRQLMAYGELCASWPTIVRASQSLNLGGQGLAVRA